MAEPTAPQPLSKFRAIPEPIRKFLTDKTTVAKRIGFLDTYGLSMSASQKLFAALDKVYDKEATLAELPALVQSATGLPPEKTKQLVLDIAGFEMLPISTHIGDVEAFIRSLGGDPSKYPANRIVIRTVTPMDVAADVLREHPEVKIPAHLELRLREIMESRVRGVRKDEETVLRMTRAEKIGGVGIAKDIAEMLLAALLSKMQTVKVENAAPTPAVASPIPPNILPGKENVTVPSPLAEEIRMIKPTAVTAASGVKVAIQKGDAASPEDEREAMVIRDQVLPNVVSQKTVDIDREITTGAVKVIEAVGIALPPELSERFRALIVTRLKDVRDTAETKALLTRASTSGGMGFSPSIAEKVSAEIEKQFSALHGALATSSAQEKEKFVQSSTATTRDRDEGRKQTELDELDRLYSSITRKPAAPRPSTPPLTPTLSPLGRGGSQTPSPLGRDTGRAQPAPAPRPPAMPVTPVTPSPKMQDVRPPMVAAHLTGPTEELRNLTLTDFRRLSSDPKEATLKLGDKLDLLEGESYARRIEGVKAWQESEVNRLYGEILQTSFGTGVPIPQVLRDRETAKQPTLTEREVNAIMEFNRKLKY